MSFWKTCGTRGAILEGWREHRMHRTALLVTGAHGAGDSNYHPVQGNTTL